MPGSSFIDSRARSEIFPPSRRWHHAAFVGRTAREISEIENVPIGTVKTRIRTALHKLRAALEVNDDF